MSNTNDDVIFLLDAIISITTNDKDITPDVPFDYGQYVQEVIPMFLSNGYSRDLICEMFDVVGIYISLENADKILHDVNYASLRGKCYTILMGNLIDTQVNDTDSVMIYLTNSELLEYTAFIDSTKPPKVCTDVFGMAWEVKCPFCDKGTYINSANMHDTTHECSHCGAEFELSKNLAIH